MPLDSVCFEKYRNSFRLYDSDGDGKITAAELSRALSIIGYKPTTSECREMITEADKDRDRAINLDEFIIMMIQRYHHHELQVVSVQKRIFEYFDKDEDGKINLQEFFLVCHALDVNAPENAKLQAFMAQIRPERETICFKRFRKALLVLTKDS